MLGGLPADRKNDLGGEAPPPSLFLSRESCFPARARLRHSFIRVRRCSSLNQTRSNALPCAPDRYRPRPSLLEVETFELARPLSRSDSFRRSDRAQLILRQLALISPELCAFADLESGLVPSPNNEPAKRSGSGENRVLLALDGTNKLWDDPVNERCPICPRCRNGLQR
jgi:hypothetical protein